MNEEDEAFNEIERRSKVKQTLVKAQLDKPKREWVGLTDEEMEYIRNAWGVSNYRVIEDTEAKLKEKNT